MKKLFIIAGEASGDLHAASLLKELYKIISSSHLIVKAVGGNHLEEAGAKLFFNCKYLNSVGLTEVIKNLSLYLGLEKELMFELSVFMPDILILVDFPGFNLRIAKKVKKKFPHIKIVYYLPPQVWAWNQSRTKILAKYCDLVLCGLPFEEEFHRSRKVNAFYVGNPIVSELEKYDREKIRLELGVGKNDNLIGLFPGSRNSEIHYMLPVLLNGAELLSKVFPNYRFLIAQAHTLSNLENKVCEYIKKNNLLHLNGQIKVLPSGNNHRLLCASDLVWLASGTVTLEAALYDTPMILGYRSNFINYFLFLLLKKVNMVGLPNIVLGEKVVPEILQADATPENYYAITKEWLEVPGHLEKIRNRLKQVKEKLGTSNSSQQAALKIRELMPEYKVTIGIKIT